MKASITIILTLLLGSFNALSQQIAGKEIPVDAKKMLKQIMIESGVNYVYVSSTNRTIAEQVGAMYGLILSYDEGFDFGIRDAKTRLYGPEADAVLDVLAKNRNKDNVKQLMIEELERVLQSAKDNNRLMHVDRPEYIVFDLSLRDETFDDKGRKLPARFRPYNMIASFSSKAKEYEQKKKDPSFSRKREG